MGVMLMGCSSWDWSSSLTRAISWRGNTAYESARNRWAEKLRGIDVDRFPAFHQGQLLEAQITVDTGYGCAAGRQVRIEQQP